MAAQTISDNDANKQTLDGMCEADEVRVCSTLLQLRELWTPPAPPEQHTRFLGYDVTQRHDGN